MVLPIAILMRRKRLHLKKSNSHFSVFLVLISIITALMPSDLP